MRMRAKRTPLPERLTLSSDDGDVHIRLRKDARARRYLLRIPTDQSGPIMTVPKSGDLKRAEQFARQHLEWLVSRLNQKPDSVPFEDGSIIPLRGEGHQIIALGGLRGLISVRSSENGPMPELHVPGAPEHISRKLTNYLKEEARKDLTLACTQHSETLGRKFSAISIRDTKSRWGSCASNGRLSFSWRLVLAPPEILDYVAAHEVAHLAEMNHSARFWRICEELAPHTRHAREWLKTNGAHLHAYG